MIYRQLPVIEKQHLQNQKYVAESGAQHPTLQGRKHIYKTHVSLKIGAGAHARKMKVISAGISFMGKCNRTKREKEPQ